MKKYQRPEISTLYYQSSDVITLSNAQAGTSIDDMLSLELGDH